jgi:hypothetical protein
LILIEDKTLLKLWGIIVSQTYIQWIVFVLLVCNRAHYFKLVYEEHIENCMLRLKAVRCLIRSVQRQMGVCNFFARMQEQICFTDEKMLILYSD